MQSLASQRRGRQLFPKNLKKYGIKDKVLIEENEKGIILKPLPSPNDDFGSLKALFKGKSAKELLKEARTEESAKDKEWIKRVGSPNV